MSNTNNYNNYDMNMPQASYIKGRMHYNINNCEGSIVCPDWVNQYNAPIPTRPLETMDYSHSFINKYNESVNIQDAYNTPHNLYTAASQPLNYSQSNYPFYNPVLPMYGFDNSKDLDKDMEYMKNLYPSISKKIQHEVDEECDKLEYEGSCMFDEYPDKCHLGSIVARIYDKIASTIDLDSLTTMEVSTENKEKAEDVVKTQQFFDNRRRNPFLNNLIEIIFFNELLHRRRRFRRRRRWQ